jgi:hypothetical protein
MGELRRARAFNMVLLEIVHNFGTELTEYRSQDPMIARDTHACIHIVSFDHTPLPHADMMLNDVMGLNIYDLESFFPTMSDDIKRGDLISNADESGYRASGVYIFNGQEVQPLSMMYDEHGHVPSDFCIITEFAPGFWQPIGFDSCYMNYKGVDENTKPDLYWHAEPEIEFINLGKLGIEEQFHEIIKSLKLGMIDFAWMGKRYLLSVTASVVQRNGILLVFRMGPKDIKKMNIDSDAYAYIMYTG